MIGLASVYSLLISASISTFIFKLTFINAENTDIPLMSISNLDNDDLYVLGKFKWQPKYDHLESTELRKAHSVAPSEEAVEFNHFRKSRETNGIDSTLLRRSSSGGSSPFTGSRPGGGGKAASPFSAGTANGVGPFSGSSKGSAGGPFSGVLSTSGGIGNSPFSTNGSAKSSTFDKTSPFTGNSMLSSGPGSLSGGLFHLNKDLLGGKDFSKNLVTKQYYGSGKVGQTNLNGNNYAISDVDESKFDTTAYQSMIQSLFKTDNVDTQLAGLGGTPFDGESVRNSFDNERGHHDTYKESSVGSYADLSAYGSASGRASSQTQSENNRNSNENADYNSYRGSSGTFSDRNSDINTSPFHVKDSGSKHGDSFQGPFNASPFRKDGDVGRTSNSGPLSMNSNMDSYIGHSPFTINSKGNEQSPFSATHGSNNDKGQNPFSLNEVSNNNKGQNPFDTSHFTDNYNNQSPFSSNKFTNNANVHNPFDASSFSNNGMGKGPFNSNVGSGSTGQNPFDTSSFSTNGQGPFDSNAMSSDSGQNPFDTSQFESSSSGGHMYQNGVSHIQSSDRKYGLDEFGNIDFAKLSGVSGHSEALSSSYTGTGSSYSSSHDGNSGSRNSEYGAYSSKLNPGSISTGLDNGNSGLSSSQYKTPFESDNYNDLIDNPFSSSSYFDTNKNNFKSPYESKSGGLDSMSYSRTGFPSDYNGHSETYSNIGSAPSGNPFNQGGQSVPSNGRLSGR